MHLLKLRRQDGADGSGVDAAIGVAAGLLDRPGRRSGRRRSGCSAASGATLSSARISVRALSMSTTWKVRGPSPGIVTPVQMELYGFMRSPVALRGSNCSKHFEIAGSAG